MQMHIITCVCHLERAAKLNPNSYSDKASQSLVSTASYMTSASARPEPSSSPAATSIPAIASPPVPGGLMTYSSQATLDSETTICSSEKGGPFSQISNFLNVSDDNVKEEPSSPLVSQTAAKLSPKSLSPSNFGEQNEHTKESRKSPPLVRVTSDKTFLYGPKPVVSPKKTKKCQLCGWTFTSSINALEHMRRHGSNNYVCQICHRAFASNDKLEVHVRSHHTDKPYKCTLCDREFSRSGNLATHLRTHTHTKPFECGFCHKRFSQRVNMELHTRTHTGVRPYACGVCNRTFTSCSNMRRHWRQVHPTIPEPKLGTTQLKNGMPEKQFYSDPVLSKTFLRPQVPFDEHSDIESGASQFDEPPVQPTKENTANGLEHRPSSSSYRTSMKKPDKANPVSPSKKIKAANHGSIDNGQDDIDWNMLPSERLNLSRARSAVRQHMTVPPAKRRRSTYTSEESLMTSPISNDVSAIKQLIAGMTDSETYHYTPSKDGGTFGLLLGETFTPVDFPQLKPSDVEESSSESESDASDIEEASIVSRSSSSAKAAVNDTVLPCKMPPTTPCLKENLSKNYLSTERLSTKHAPVQKPPIDRNVTMRSSKITKNPLTCNEQPENNNSPKFLTSNSSLEPNPRPLHTDVTNGSKAYMEVNSMPYQRRLELRQREHAEEEKRQREKRDQMPAKRSRILHRYAMLNAATNIYAETSTPVFGFARIAHEADMGEASPPLSSPTLTPITNQLSVPKKLAFTPPITGGHLAPETQEFRGEKSSTSAPSSFPIFNPSVTDLLQPNIPSINPTMLHFSNANSTHPGPRSGGVTPVTASLTHPVYGLNLANDTLNADTPTTSLDTSGVAHHTNTPYVAGNYDMQARAIDINNSAWTMAMLANQSYPFSVGGAPHQSWLGLNSPCSPEVSAQLQYMYAYNPHLALAQWAQLQALQTSVSTAGLRSTMSAFGYTPSPTTVPSAYSSTTMINDPNFSQPPMFSTPVNPPLPRMAVTIEDIITRGSTRSSETKSTGLTPTVQLTSDIGGHSAFGIPYQNNLVANPPSEVCKKELDELERSGLEPEKSSNQDFTQIMPQKTPYKEEITIHRRISGTGCSVKQNESPSSETLSEGVAKQDTDMNKMAASREQLRHKSNYSSTHVLSSEESSCISNVSRASLPIDTEAPLIEESLPDNVYPSESNGAPNSSAASRIPPVVIPARLRDKATNMSASASRNSPRTCQ